VGLALWTLTVAAGVWLLVTSIRREPSPVVAEERPVTLPAGASARTKDLFDPPSLRAAKREQVPMWALAEFTHPALAVTGFAFWLLYALVHDRIFASIALGVMLGAIAAGVTWATVNGRASKRGADHAMSFSPRALAFHIAGAAATLLVAALIAARV
jgi:hypothetical protein